MDNVNVNNFFGEEEIFGVNFFGLSDWFNLTGNDGEHFQINTIELIETSPESWLAKSLKDFSHIDGSMLIRAVCDHDKDSKGSSQIFYSLGFTGSGGACRSSSIKHGKGLGKGDIASVS